MDELINIKDALPVLEQVVLVRYPSGYDGSDIYNWGARVDDGEGWCWGVKVGYGGDIRLNETASWNQIESDDDYQITHWMRLPKPPGT